MNTARLTRGQRLTVAYGLEHISYLESEIKKQHSSEPTDETQGEIRALFVELDAWRQKVGSLKKVGAT